MRKSIVPVSLIAGILSISPIVSYAEEASIEGNGGIYFGAEFVFLESDATHTYSNGAPSGDSSPEGTYPGIFFGYESLKGNYSFGVEIGYGQPDADGSFTNNSGITSEGTVELTEEYFLSLTAGYYMSEYEIRPYLRAGVSTMDADIEGGSADNASGNKYSAEFSGWHFALGAEKEISESLSARFEYKVTDYGDESGSLAPDFPTVTMPVELETQTLSLGLKYSY